jgi:HlyD family secretion protein
VGLTRTLLLVLATALAAGAGGFFVQKMLPGEGMGTPTTTHPGQAGVPRTKVTALGRLEPGTEIISVGLPAGSRVERLAVKEEEWVTQGQPLAYLDSHDEMAAARDSAKVQLKEARKRLEAETDFGNASVEAARLRIQQTEEVSPLAVEAQEAEVRRSQAEVEKTQLDLRRSEQMLADKAIPKSQHDGAVLVARQAEEHLAAAKATLAQLKRDREIKLLLGRAEKKSAEAGSLRAQLAAQVDSLAAALAVAEARLQRTVIRAPVAGEVIKVLTHAGEAAGKEPLLKMGDTHAMFAVAEVYETDVRHVAKGQRATITSKAFPETITGVVERVGKLIHKNDVLGIDPTADADARVVEVRIRLDDSSVAARYNYLQVDVAIDVGGPP